MSHIDNLSGTLVVIAELEAEIFSREKRLVFERTALRQHDRMISFNAGEIAAYEAVLSSLSKRHQKMVTARIEAIKKTMGDLST